MSSWPTAIISVLLRIGMPNLFYTFTLTVCSYDYSEVLGNTVKIRIKIGSFLIFWKSRLQVP